MKQTPCEFMMWNGLPVIRRELAESMINNHDLTQKETAEKLGVTPAAICQYVSGKRGKIRIIDKKILKEIDSSAKKIIEKGPSIVVHETCRICKIMRGSGIFSFYCDACNPDLE
ncbi:MAG: helix-turn-helix domain-containing protein [Thermoplasmatota archaeon]